MKKISFYIPAMVLAIGLLSSCGDNTTEHTESIRYVKATEVLPSQGNDVLIYNGVVKERRDVTLSFKVGGPVNELLVDVGDYVTKGQAIAKIDKRDYNIQLQAREAQYTQAKGEYERYQELYKRKKLPENTLDKLKAGYLMAKSQYEAAVNALEDTELKAPFSGYVNKKFIENFETVGPGVPIIQLLDFSDLEVVVSIPENNINEMSEVYKITCDIRNANKTSIPATVKSISKKSGSDRMFEAKILLEDSDANHEIKPGMVAKVKVQKSNSDNKNLLVPIESVFSSGQKKYVWLIDNNSHKVKKQEVNVSEIQGNGLVEISAAINIGDIVVTAGIHSLVENQEVKVLPKKSETNIGGLL
ncbi:efflux RND transporter periplasmic adaptor subunit [Plebeiibacterium sediminum]|uniref:Efflux RND transporter periplasmic adaptor subunit n=1 Tax=Plebeiibacterium sediminum TaxID=2992112 RepID=A0AAE3M3A3_9BACT|nr:efflux RND transporter periplasmic adaptor subunit [Plebeiobacterium sediminum]MCW3786020.1 efflux RND transporter periplasmic adaptor subunit [Plebeiobacterium sediminum]